MTLNHSFHDTAQERPSGVSRSALFSFFAEVGVSYEKTYSEFLTLTLGAKKPFSGFVACALIIKLDSKSS